MARWDYDTVFYRVLCSALLVVALTFTVILTNVFIDIDGMMYKKNKAITEKIDTEQADVDDDVPTDVAPGDDYNDYGDYYGERTKRSLDTQDYDLQIKDPNVKKVIYNQLAALLDDLDKEESKTIKINRQRNDQSKSYLDTNNPNVHDKHKQNLELLDTESDKYREINSKIDADTNYKTEFVVFVPKKIKYDTELSDKGHVKDIYSIDNEDMKHLAMHNVILQGIVGHMELGEVYRKVHALYHNYGGNDNEREVQHPHHEKQFFNELATCKRLQKEILETKPYQTAAIKEMKTSTEKPIGRNVMIKTIIDINSQTNEKTNQDTSKENVNGIIKMIYNGKILKFKRLDESTTSKPKSTNVYEEISTSEKNKDNVKKLENKVLNSDRNESTTYVPNAYMNKMISEYFKRISKESNLDDNKKIITKRLKRHIKIRYENDNIKITTEAPKHKEAKEEDELFVEIETHFDSKGMKGEKKKKFITELIAKIQKAIHSENEVKKKKHKHLHVKRRSQNPLDNVNTASVAKTSLDHLMHRHIDPISKSVPMHNKLPLFTDDKDDEWRKKIYGPRFLTASKSINSAEMSEVDADYNKLLNNGIPQRLQQPLNSEVENSIVSPDLGRSQFVVRDIAGSGFSIGFNQYVGEPPDAESMKLFNGLENIIQTYHQKYDEDGGKENAETPLRQEIFEEPEHYEYPPERDNHMIVRRSLKKFKQDYHSNEYKGVFKKNLLNYNNYQDIYNGKDKSLAQSKAKNKNLFIDDNILKKELNPAEIFNLADMLERQKRSLTVKKISYLKNKKKLNRYINTKSMASKKIFRQNKRSKRQIGKIRIIAKDISDNYKHPEEDIFFFSDDKVLADRAMVKEVEIPELEPKETNHEERFVFTPQHPPHDHYDAIPPDHISEDHFDIISPRKVTENHYGIISPYIFEPSDTNNIFSRKSRHNSLMSKYPHLFLEDIPKFQENLLESLMANENTEEKNKIEPTSVVTAETDELQPKVPNTHPNIQELRDFPSQEKSNYKVTVKFIPKNKTSLNSGFKEIHTSINKSYDKNGLTYSSLVNVTEISRVEKINHTKDSFHPSAKQFKRDQVKLQNIIQQHKTRIEEQIAHLNKEKEKLNRIDNLNAQFIKDIPKDNVDIATPENLEKKLQATKEDIGRMYKVETTTEQATTTKYLQEDLDKSKIIQTIERNENITNEILKKIDRKTNILQTFLDKLLTKLESNMQKAGSDTKEENVTKPQTIKTNDINSYLSHLLFNEKNITGIPFIYAFQQQNKISNKENSKTVPIANIVYQGHIHTETIKPEIRRRSWTSNDVKNSSKFFIDDIEEYKVLPVVGKTEFTSNVTKP